MPSLIVMFFLVIGVGPAGHCNYTTLPDGTPVCTAVQFLRLFFCFPVLPLSEPRLIMNPQACQRTYRFISLDNECCAGVFWKCMAWAYLRWLTFGLCTFFKPSASDPNAVYLMLAKALGRGSGSKGETGSAPPTPQSPSSQPPKTVQVVVPAQGEPHRPTEEPLLYDEAT